MRHVTDAPPPLLDWIPSVTPTMVAPTHLADWCAMLQRASRRERVRGLCAVPIRHYKSWTAFHGIAWVLKEVDPSFRFIYMTHTKHYADQRGRDIRDLCKRVGIKVERGHDTMAEWRSEEGGGVIAMSAESSALGKDADGIIVDDPFEGPEAADDPEVRQRVDETIAFYTSRLSPGGFCLVLMSRFHPDDAIGRRLRRTVESWDYIHHRALSDEGVAYAPEVRSADELRRIRAELREIDPRERTWFSQFQNEPRSDSGDLFKAPKRYGELPTEPGWRDVMGIDLAYSQSKRADFFALVLLRVWGSTAYVRLVSRLKADLSVLEQEIRRVWAWNGSRVSPYSYISGPEKGAIVYFGDRGVQVNAMPARYNKLVRAQKTIDKWNAGEILVPLGTECDGFLGRVAAFRGIEGDDDDEVDALVSAIDGGMWSGGQSATRLVGERRI